MARRRRTSVRATRRAIFAGVERLGRKTELWLGWTKGGGVSDEIGSVDEEGGDEGEDVVMIWRIVDVDVIEKLAARAFPGLADAMIV